MYLKYRVPNFREELGAIGIGLCAGLAAVAFHWLLEVVDTGRMQLALAVPKQSFFVNLVVVIGCGLCAAISVALVRYFAPEAEGSGIAAVIKAHKSVAPVRAIRIIWVKFMGGVFAMAAGMPLGREGPSVQIGAMTGVCLKRLFPAEYYRTRAIHLGAAAGLSAAFNAPLTGLLFSFELLHQPFTRRNCYETLMVCAVADWVCRALNGPSLEMPIQTYSSSNLSELPVFILMGFWAGLVALLFQMLLLKSYKWFHHTATKPVIAVLMTFAWGCILGGVLMLAPELLGVGQPLFREAIANRMTLVAAITALVIRIPLTAMSYSTGAPGGLIVPALLFGTLSGQIFSSATLGIFGPLEPDFHNLCIVAGMAASLGALFRTPLTATIMAVEITGTFTCILQISFAYVAAHTLLTAFKQPDIYEAIATLHNKELHADASGTNRESE
jgi:chloride channel protein, CIC family